MPETRCVASLLVMFQFYSNAAYPARHRRAQVQCSKITDDQLSVAHIHVVIAWFRNNRIYTYLQSRANVRIHGFLFDSIHNCRP